MDCRDIVPKAYFLGLTQGRPIRRDRFAQLALLAKDVADAPAEFRDAHAAIGTLIRESEREGCDLDGLPLTSFKSAHALFGDDALDWLEPAKSVARRDVPGGTGPTAVRAQLRAAREALSPVAEVARGNELILRAI